MASLLDRTKQQLYTILRKTEKYTKTDMVYLARGGFWLTLGQGFSFIFSFLLAIAFANFVPKEVYGNYKYILSLLGILAISTLPGMNLAVTQSVARGYDGSFSIALKTKIRWGILGGIASVGIGVYYYLLGNTSLGIIFLMAAAFLPLMDSFTLYNSTLAGKKLFFISTQFNTSIQLIVSAALITTVFLSGNIFLIIFVYLFSYTSLRFLYTKIIEKKYLANDNIEEGTIHFGKHLSFIGILGAISSYLDSLLLFHFLGAPALASYALAQASTNPVKGLIKSIINLAHPKFAIQDKEILKKALPQKIRKAFFLIFPFIIMYIFILPYLYDIFFPQYTSSAKYAQIIALSFFFFPEKLKSIAITAQTKKRALYILNTINPIINISLMIILIPLYGIWGAVITMLLQQFIALCLSQYYFKKM